MALVKLVKGQNINLTRQFNGQTKFRVGLSWDTGAQTFDLDAIALLLTDKVDAGGKVPNEDFAAAYFNNDPDRPNYQKITFQTPSGVVGFQSIDGSVKNFGDNRTGEGSGDDETIELDLSKVDPRIKSILILVNIYTEDDPTKNFNFGMVKNAMVKLYEGNSDVPALCFELSEDFSTEHNLEFVEVYLHNNEWKFKALGNGNNNTFAEELKKFGIPC